MLTQYTISCPETPAQLRALLEIRAGDAQFSMQRLIDYLEAVNSGERNAFIKTYLNPVRASSILTVTDAPIATEELFLAGIAYAAVASGPDVNQFVIGGTPAITAANIYGMFQASPDFALNFTATYVAAATTVLVTSKVPGVLGNGALIINSLTGVAFPAFTNGSDGTNATISKGVSYVVPSGTNFTGIFITSDNLPTLEDAIDTQSSGPTASLTRLIDFHESVSYSRSALFMTRTGGLTGPAIVTFSGQPTAAQTITLNAVVFTAVASSPGATSFLIGATKEDTAVNFAAVINAASSARIHGVINAQVVRNIVYLNPSTPGYLASTFTLSETLSNVTTTDFTSTAGTQVDLQLGSNTSASF